MHLGTKSSQEAVDRFQGSAPWETLPRPGQPCPDGPLSRTSHPSSAVTAARGPASRPDPGVTRGTHRWQGGRDLHPVFLNSLLFF